MRSTSIAKQFSVFPYLPHYHFFLLLYLTVLLVAHLVSDVSARQAEKNVSALSQNNCTASYQAALEDVFTIKKQCEGAAFYDCCQVRSTSKQGCISQSTPFN